MNNSEQTNRYSWIISEKHSIQKFLLGKKNANELWYFKTKYGQTWKLENKKLHKLFHTITAFNFLQTEKMMFTLIIDPIIWTTKRQMDLQTDKPETH